MSGSLITDEMVEAVTRSLHPGLFEDDGLLHPALALSGQWQARRKVRIALEAIEPMLMKAFAGEVSLGSDWQIEDPRINYVDVQVDKDFYEALRKAEVE